MEKSIDREKLLREQAELKKTLLEATKALEKLKKPVDTGESGAGARKEWDIEPEVPPALETPASSPETTPKPETPSMLETSKPEETKEEILARLGLEKGQTVKIREDFFDKSSRGKIGIIGEIDEEGNLIIDDEKGKFLEVIPKDDLTPVGIKEYLNLILEPTEETSEQGEPIPPIPSVATPENLEETDVIEKVEQFTPEEKKMEYDVEPIDFEKKDEPEIPSIEEEPNILEKLSLTPGQRIEMVSGDEEENEEQKNATQQTEKDAALVELKKTIENAKKIIEENTKREEVIIKKLKELREESDKAPKKTDEKMSEESLSDVETKLTEAQEELSRIYDDYHIKYNELRNLSKLRWRKRKKKRKKKKN